jgi:methyltransferase
LSPHLPLTAAIVFIAMLLEARHASRNERAQRARGGVEPPDDVYGVMRLVYPASFAAMLVEGAVRGAPTSAAVIAGAALFAASKTLKIWAIRSLGPSWTFRVIVVPGAALVETGPYRWLRHPNYVAVIGELASVAMMTGALVAGPTALTVFGLLLVRRIRVEDRSLGDRGSQARRDV